MFETLSDKLRDVLKGLRGESRLTEENIDGAMRNVRLALLEADVNYQVVKQFIDRAKAKALGTEVVGSLKPDQVLYKVVYDEMTEMLGGASSRIVFNKRGLNVVMMVGLQGSGKTTSTGKLAKWLSENERRNPLLVSVDVYRPAARNQLKVIGDAIGRRVFEPEGVEDPMSIVRLAVKEAELTGFDTLMIDTAGRLHVDDELMTELERIKAETHPVEILFVADAMTGQDAVKSAKEFHDRIGVTGVVLTKMDGDARGGAAISIKEVTGQPIKFIGVGEKYDALEPFYPDRIAQRILGMGDVLSLVEKVQSEVDEKEAARLQKKLVEDKFTLEDFRDQLKQVKRLGSLDSLIGMLPTGLFGGMRVTPEMSSEMEGKFKKTEAIISSMTQVERRNHKVLDGSRRKRIARGSGTSVQEVNEMIREYEEMRRMMRMVTSGGLGALGGMMGGRAAGALGGMKPKRKVKKKKKGRK
ncbi:MAG TPA: signal recognition particle protein [Blastocatellia bacterium]|nr:signal recognition particle protein [Blastocatellia bacterium]